MMVAPTRHTHDRIHRPSSVSALGNRGLAEEPSLTDVREPVSTAGRRIVLHIARTDRIVLVRCASSRFRG
jgi:hypothetical protein